MPGPRQARTIVTLTSDFGLHDSYVAAMKAAVLREYDDVRLIDITHNVPRHDILCASITLERAIDGFPPGSVHLAVVDPGVGTDRKLIIGTINEQRIVCPDNGLITWAWRLHGGGSVSEITWRPARSSWTFHGRDVMAPVAARLARGDDPSSFSKPLAKPVLLDLMPAPPDQTRGHIIHIDHFGNATTNIRQQAVADAARLSVKVNRRTIGKVKRTYWDVAPGKPLALIGSSGLLEIAVRDGSARDHLNIRVGDAVTLR
jgi:S-adenosylmethionine hydrolase